MTAQTDELRGPHRVAGRARAAGRLEPARRVGGAHAPRPPCCADLRGARRFRRRRAACSPTGGRSSCSCATSCGGASTWSHWTAWTSSKHWTRTSTGRRRSTATSLSTTTVGTGPDARSAARVIIDEAPDRSTGALARAADPRRSGRRSRLGDPRRGRPDRIRGAGNRRGSSTRDGPALAFRT